MIPGLLVVLGLVDAMFCGFRDAAGRYLRIDKRAYYRRALVRGFLFGLVAVAALGGLAGVLIATAADPPAVYATMCSAGEIMVWIYGAYATLVLAALLVYTIPVSDLSTLATVIILGPFTMVRPFVIWAGAIAAVVAVREARTATLALASAATLTLLERVLGRAWRGAANPLS